MVQAEEIPRRPLGRTGVKVSALGLGGHHLGDCKTVEDAMRLVHEAVDAGITFCDNCWEYWNGRAEDWLGRALATRRDKVFLMTKVCTHGRGAGLAMKMLEESLLRLNCLDATFRSFEKQVLPELQNRGIAALGMKPLGGTATAIKAGLVKAEEMLRYAMSLPVATTITGMDSLDVLHQNLRIARGFKAMSAEEMQALRDRCAQAAGDGRYEFYKLSLRFDNPQARLPHGFPLDITQKEVQEMLYKEAGGP